MQPEAGWAVPAERIRGLLSPVVALLGSSLMMCCLVTLPDVVIGWPALSTVNARLPGWSGVALIVAVGTAAVSLLTCTRLGSAPSLALGTTAALLGLALSGDVTSGGQVVMVLVLLALAIGALFASGLCILEELPPHPARIAFLGWVLPWAAGMGTLGWLTLRDRTSTQTRLGLHPPALVLAAGAAVLLLWAVGTLILEPRREPDPDRRGWENAWAGLAVLVVSAGSLVMLIGFQPGLSPSWGRPVILLSAAVVASGLVACGMAIPEATARPAFLAVVVAIATGPACIHALLLVSAEESGSLSGWVLVVLTAAGCVGVWVGWRWPQTALTAGFVLLAVAAAGGWVMPAHEWLMMAAAAPLSLAVAAAIAGGLRIAGTSRMRLRFVSIAGLSGLLLGLIAAPTITWALGAEMTGTADARAGGRVLLGLTFALSVLAAAVCAVLPTTDSSANLGGLPAHDPQTNLDAAAQVRP